jgi:macrolide phosphotransferase
MEQKHQDIITLAKKYEINLQKESLKFEGMGLDFQVVFATDEEGEKWILRIPRRSDAIEKVAKEKKLLEGIHKQQSVFQVPHWEIATDELIAYKEVKGKPAVTFDEESHEEKWEFDQNNVPTAYVTSFARALAALHALDPKQLTEIEVIPADELRQHMKRRMERIKKTFDIADSLWERWQEWLQQEEMWPEKVGVIHGDLFPGHTLIDESNQVTGIIDWTEAKVSDTATDFTAFYLLFGEDALDQLIEEYAKQGGYTWAKMKDHIKEHVNIQALTIAEFALTSGSEEYKTMADSMLKSSD